MDFVGFLQFAVKYFLEVLAWPLLGIVYPLYASIRAIETNSFADTQKLNTYWVIFSSTLLLELALGRLLEWFQFWPYIRLMMVCWLVIPYFDGAFYVYKLLIQPCFSVEIRVFFKFSNKHNESPSVREKVVAEVETCARENRSEAPENIIACKPNSSSNVTKKEIEVVEETAKNQVTSVEQVSQAEPKRFHQTEDRKFVAAETQEKFIRVGAGKQLLGTPSVVKKNWTCPLCHVKIQSEKTMVSHLQGGKHKAAYEALEANNKTFLLKTIPPPIPKESPQQTKPGCSASQNGLKQKVIASDRLADKHENESENGLPHRSRRSRRRSRNKTKEEGMEG
ncbi:hypothetical protein UlMin_032467 [Ulmus minor]